jgi:hypothetical protein
MVQERALATLASAFGVLSCVGLYGLQTYRVARRTKEIGVRIAPGAARHRIIAMVLKNAVGLVSIAVLIGLPAAWAASQIRWWRCGTSRLQTIGVRRYCGGTSATPNLR